MTHETSAVFRVIESNIDGITNIMKGQDDDERQPDYLSDWLLDNLKIQTTINAVLKLLPDITFLILIWLSSCQLRAKVARWAAIRAYTPPLAPAR